MSPKKLVIIGGGPAGNAAALAAARAGASGILLVENDALGGTCTNRGCIPTKFLLARTGRGGGEGDSAGAWPRVIAHKNALVKGLSRSIEATCIEEGVEIARGTGRLADPHLVEITAADGAVTAVEAERIILATGSVPARPPAFAIDGESVITSDEALDLEKPPASILIVGSGAVGAEFAFIFHRAGSRVTILEAEERLFPVEDCEVHDLFTGIFERMGIECITGDPVVAVDRTPREGPAVTLASGRVVAADKVLVSVGRALRSAGLGLEKAGVAVGEKGEVPVDGALRTSQPHIFAAGDVTGGLLLAHLASFQGEQAALRAVGATAREVPYFACPWAVFTTPEIASVGVTEEEARRKGTPCRSAVVPWMENIKARIDRATDGFVKVVVHEETGVVIGGTVVGPHASDMIHIIAGAVRTWATASDLASALYVHPGLAETLQEAALKLG